MHFLVIYDRAAGTLLHEEAAFAARGEAMRARFEEEARHHGDPNVEVVVLDAPSAEALRRTHARYFKSLSQFRSAGPRPSRPTSGRHSVGVQAAN